MSALAELLARSRMILVFTGAGISTGSGIPDFRGPGGIWNTRRPVYFHDFVASEEARVEHWQYKLDQHEVMARARPNAAHLALVELDRMGRLDTLVTQNIDGLHEAAGHDPARIVELHGTNRWIECLSCGERSEPAPHMESFRRTRVPPRCGCGGLLKSATISFGQPMPAEPMRRAVEAAERCDAVVSIGSTLEVHPAASVPLAAARRGVPYAVVNRGPTAHDDIATLRVEGDVVEILPAALRLIDSPSS